jgi:hypothetical protein
MYNGEGFGRGENHVVNLFVSEHLDFGLNGGIETK